MYGSACPAWSPFSSTHTSKLGLPLVFGYLAQILANCRSAQSKLIP